MRNQCKKNRKANIVALVVCCAIVASSLGMADAYGTRRNSYGGTGLGTYGRGSGYGNRNQWGYDMYPNNNHGFGRGGGMNPCGYGGGAGGGGFYPQNQCGCQGSSYGSGGQCRPSGYGSGYGGYGQYGGNYGGYGGSSGGYGGYGGNAGGYGGSQGFGTHGFGGGYGRGSSGYGGYGRGTYGSGGYGGSSGSGGFGFMDGGMFAEDMLGSGWDSHDAAASTSSGQTQTGSAAGPTSLTHEGGSFERSNESPNQLGQWSERFAEEPAFRTFYQPGQQPGQQQQHNMPQQPSSMVTYAGDNGSQAQQRAATDGHFIVHNGHDLATGDTLNNNNNHNNNINNNGQTNHNGQPNRAHASAIASSALLNSARQSLGIIPSIPSSTTTPAPEYIMINQGARRGANEDN